MSRSIPRPVIAVMAIAALLVTLLPPAAVRGDTPPDHLVLSEVVTGGASASDELIEIHNPTGAPLPLEGLEVVYATASGATVSRRAAWAVGAPSVPAGGHVLVANEAGAFAPIADATYASGIAASGGSLALRILGASSAIDAVGWGSTTSSWREGSPAAVAPSGGSVERRPGGTLGSGVDTGDNASDFTVREVPDPQNLASPPTPAPGTSPTPVPTAPASAEATAPPSVAATVTPTPLPTVGPTPTPVATPTATLPIADARLVADGTAVTIEGTALTASNFTDGGGYVVDGSGGIAVLVDGGAFARGARLRLHGTVDDRYAQRTLRVAPEDLAVMGIGSQPPAVAVSTGTVGEAFEGTLVRLGGRVAGAPTTLTAGLAFDVDDGSGPVRILVGSGTGIATTTWEPGATVTVVGVAGQRDSSGSGASGYRVLPRDAADIADVEPPSPATPAPTTPGGSASASASPTAEPGGVTTIAAARALPKNDRVRIRGTVTMPTGVVDDATAVIQDATAAIVVRLAEEAGTLALGQLVELEGTRSTKGGMETLRVTATPRVLGTSSEPPPSVLRTGDAGEAVEARLVTVRGALVASARRASTGSVSFEVDDGSGSLRVAVPAVLGLDDEPLVAGAWVEVRGILGQETTGSQPQRGYRVWPRTTGDIRVTAAVSGAGPGGNGTHRASDGQGGSPVPELADLGALAEAAAGGGPLDGDVGATLVTGPWRALRIGGLLWDGGRLVALAPGEADRVRAVLGNRRPPVALVLGGLQPAGTGPYGLPLVRVGSAPDDLVVTDATPVPPHLAASPGTAPRWVTVVGRHVAAGERHRILVDRAAGLSVDRRCDDAGSWPDGVVAVRGIGLDDGPVDIVVPCDGIDPAPALRLGPSRSGGGAGAERMTATVAARSEGSGGSSSPLGVILLFLAAAGLAAVAGVAGRLRESDEPSPEPGGGGAEQEPERVGTAVAPPVLTLVHLPRERAP